MVLFLVVFHLTPLPFLWHEMHAVLLFVFLLRSSNSFIFFPSNTQKQTRRTRKLDKLSHDRQTGEAAGLPMARRDLHHVPLRAELVHRHVGAERDGQGCAENGGQKKMCNSFADS
jgi:hypothetical protein